MSTGRTLVIGGGLGGLTAALALRRLGMTVDIYERAPGFEMVGAGLTITPSVRKAVRYLGFEAAFDRAVEIPERPPLLDWQTGALLQEPTSEAGHLDEVRRIRRSAFHDLLTDALRSLGGGTVHFGHSLTGLQQDDDRVTARFENGEAVSGELLIGADGLRSTVRRYVAGPETLRFTGYVAWRFMIPMAAARPFLHGRGIMITAGPNASLTGYSVDHGKTLNCIAIVNGVDEGEGGWGVRGDHGELAAPFDDANDDVRGIIALAPPDALFKWVLYDRVPIERWTDRRVVLLGDAAHPILPFLGSGAGLAVEDGVVLARCLEASYGPAALARFERARIARATAIQRAARLQGEMFGRAERGRAAAGSPFFDERLFTYDPVTAAI